MHRDPLIDVADFNAQGGNVIIGTPGRLSDVMKRCDLLDCKSLEVGSSSKYLPETCTLQVKMELPRR